MKNKKNIHYSQQFLEQKYNNYNNKNSNINNNKMYLKIVNKGYWSGTLSMVLLEFF